MPMANSGSTGGFLRLITADFAARPLRRLSVSVGRSMTVLALRLRLPVFSDCVAEPWGEKGSVKGDPCVTDCVQVS